jgi:arylsulfatase A-like enzyme
MLVQVPMSLLKIKLPYLLFIIALATTLLVCYRPFLGSMNSSYDKLTESPFDKIIFVTIDTLRADHLSNYGYPRETAPFLSSLIERGVLFENAFTASSHTAPSHASIFTSLFPHQHNVLRNYDSLDPKFYNLSKALSAKGYEQAAITAVKFLEGNVGFPVLAPELDLESAGFSRKTWYRNAQVNIDRAINWLTKKKNPEKFFLWLHFYDVHEWDNKKNLPKEYLQTFANEGNDNIVDFVSKQHNISEKFHGTRQKFKGALDRYDGRIRFVDDQLQRLYQHIQSFDSSKNTLWVITSDHGEGLGAHNYKDHGEFLYQEQLKVPLIFFSENTYIPKRRVSDLVRTIDIMPTLLSLSGAQSAIQEQKLAGLALTPLLQYGTWNSAGISYSLAERRPKDDTPLRRNWEDGNIFSLHDLNEKFIFHSLSAHEFYDLEKDPLEERNLGLAPSQLNQEFQSGVNNMQDFYKNGQSTPSEQKLDKDQYEELKTLGYM